ncbi:atherin-like [Meles meles]|uniref:atherin-like n=1 Tax=Meles meles TaxID=9662 RepID=UPI001E69DDE2|nr:atherin-like [Meles meles]
MAEGSPSRLKTEAGFYLKRRRGVFLALSCGRLRPHAAGPLLLTLTRTQGPAQAQFRGGGRSPSARMRAERPRGPAGGRRRSGPSAPGRSPGPALLPPARLTPCPPGTRPQAPALRPHSPPRSAPAPRTSGARRLGGEVTRIFRRRVKVEEE